jgi:hypothetical protein
MRPHALPISHSEASLSLPLSLYVSHVQSLSQHLPIDVHFLVIRGRAKVLTRRGPNTRDHILLVVRETLQDIALGFLGLQVPHNVRTIHRRGEQNISISHNGRTAQQQTCRE